MLPLTVGSLFSGIGGLDLGLERGGWAVQWQIESDDFCARVLARHWPTVSRYGDIVAVDPARLAPVTLLCGGFPCQPVSVSGKRHGQLDANWLWPEFARIIRALRPPLVLVENVSGLLSVNRGAAFGEILGDLAACGYDAEWDCVPAGAVGAPHLRDRVFLVADAHGHRRQGASLHVFQRRPLQALLDAARAGARGPVADAHEAGPADDEGRARPAEPPRRGEPATDLLDSRPFQWLPEHAMVRVVHGLSRDVDAVGALGNAVVPQVAEWIGWRLRAIAETAAEG